MKCNLPGRPGAVIVGLLLSILLFSPYRKDRESASCYLIHISSIVSHLHLNLLTVTKRYDTAL